MEINIEGSPLSEFSAEAAVDLWWGNCCTTCRVNQNPRQSKSTVQDGETVAESTESKMTLEDWDSWMTKDD